MNIKCKDCVFNNLPVSLRNKLDALLKKDFFTTNCPLDEKTYGCIKKHIVSFDQYLDMLKFLKEKSLLSKEEELFLNDKFGT